MFITRKLSSALAISAFAAVAAPAAGVASQFADGGLLDEVHVTVVPVVLGAGKSLFERRLRNGAMQLAGTRTFQNGMVELRYEIRR